MNLTALPALSGWRAYLRMRQDAHAFERRLEAAAPAFGAVRSFVFNAGSL